MASADRPTIEILVGHALDDTAVRRNRTMLDEALALRPGHLAFDLRRCRSINAAGIELLLDTEHRVRHDGGRLSLLRVPTELCEMLLLARLPHLLASTPAPPGYQPRHRQTRRGPPTRASTSVDELRWWGTPAAT